MSTVSDSYSKPRLFDGNVNWLNTINEIADKVKPNTQDENYNLTYSSYMISKFIIHVSKGEKIVKSIFSVSLLDYHYSTVLHI